MHIPVIIQARMNSERLPGKVLQNVNGKPIIEYLIGRLKKSNKIGEIIIATSIEKEDEPIINYCQRKRIKFFRGSLHNVAKRFKDVIEQYGLESFIWICADSPLLDCNIVDAGIEIFKNSKYAIVTNTLKRTFPKGQSFEILGSDVFNQGYQGMKDEDDFEHLTSYFYRNSHRFLIYKRCKAILNLPGFSKRRIQKVLFGLTIMFTVVINQYIK